MAFYLYAHDQGTVDFVNSYDSKAEARAAAKRIEQELEAHPSHYAMACPWFEISAEPPYRETYEFPDMSHYG
jgi:hypothetical protein